ncbi:MAG: hypothetical protein SFW36_03105 [Leptolyngbyaceae cyanobacterium bins.59]|nr:hypothetical protein [Leptolyngbyaceae cyanobacterium bins.59]
MHLFLRFRRSFIRFLLAILALTLALTGQGWWPSHLPALARSSPSIPLSLYQGAPVIDPNRFTFGSLPAFNQEGGLQVSNTIVAALGFDPSIAWKVGDRPANVLKIGTFRNVFDLEKLTLQGIQTLTGTSLSGVKLQAFEMMSWQSMQTLVEAIPGFRDLPIERVKPIADLVSGVLPQGNPLLRVGDVLEEFPELAQTALGEILNLENYSLSSIPGLLTTKFEKFYESGMSSLAGIPGLDQVVASNFPIPLSLPVGGLVSRLDITLNTVEKNRSNPRPISGSYKAGFSVSCQARCSQLEVTNPNGGQWIAGDEQRVPGGEGPLGQVFEGKEPTGRHPYGPVFKVVVANVDEASGTAETQLFFRFCFRNAFVDLGCTPYGIGPIPFLPHREKDWLFLGIGEFGEVAAGTSEPVNHVSHLPFPAIQPSRPNPSQRRSQPNLPLPKRSIDPDYGFAILSE